MGQFAQDVQKVFATRESRTVEVPEWGKTFTVFPLTILQLQRIQAESDPFKRAARIIQVRGKDAEGKQVLDDRDVDELCAYGIGVYGPTVVARVAGEIMADMVSPEEAAKN